MNEISQRRKKGDYEYIVRCLSEKQYNEMDKWDMWNLSYAYNKLGKVYKAYEVSSFCRDSFPEFEINNNHFSWIVYKEYINEDFYKKRRDEFKNKVREIMKYRKYGEKSAYLKIIFKTLKIYKAEGEYDESLELLEKLNKYNLDSCPVKYNGKEYASYLENYYSYLTRNLYHSKKYKACIEAVKEALNRLEGFHYNNDAWFMLRSAISYIELEEFDLGMELLFKALAIKVHFVFYQKIAQCYRGKGDSLKALSYYIVAYLVERKRSMKVQVIYELYTLLNELDNEKCRIFENYYKDIRIKEGWDEGEVLLDILETEKLVDNKVIPEIIHEYFGELTGKIVKVFGKKGFVEDNNKRMFFLTTLNSITENTCCYYFNIQGYDIKRDKMNTISFIYDLGDDDNGKA